MNASFDGSEIFFNLFAYPARLVKHRLSDYKD